MSAAITLIASAFVMRLGEWSKGLNSDFVVHGQTAHNWGITAGLNIGF